MAARAKSALRAVVVAAAAVAVASDEGLKNMINKDCHKMSAERRSSPIHYMYSG